jgi:SNF2 family DNA or RNA helicase
MADDIHMQEELLQFPEYKFDTASLQVQLGLPDSERNRLQQCIQQSGGHIERAVQYYYDQLDKEKEGKPGNQEKEEKSGNQEKEEKSGNQEKEKKDQEKEEKDREKDGKGQKRKYNDDDASSNDQTKNKKQKEERPLFVWKFDDMRLRDPTWEKKNITAFNYSQWDHGLFKLRHFLEDFSAIPWDKSEEIKYDAQLNSYTITVTIRWPLELKPVYLHEWTHYRMRKYFIDYEKCTGHLFPNNSTSMKNQPIMDFVYNQAIQSTKDFPIDKKDSRLVDILNLPLKEHQLQSLQKMIHQENIRLEESFWMSWPDQPNVYLAPALSMIAVGAKHVRSEMLEHRGGFLCEPMGLGKTIETLSLIHLTRMDAQKWADEQPLLIEDKKAEIKQGQVQEIKQVQVQEIKQGQVQEIKQGQVQEIKQGQVQEIKQGQVQEIKQEEEKIRTNRGRVAATLILTPTSLMGQWQLEHQKWFRSDKRLRVLLWYGGKRTRNALDFAKYDIVLTTYNLATSDLLRQVQWYRIVLEESHNLKNPKTELTKSITRLRSDRRWCLTGTLFSKYYSDILAQVRFLLGGDRLHQLIPPDISKRSKSIQYPQDFDTYPWLKTIATHWIIRHVASESLMELPPSTLKTHLLQFSTDRQLAIYQQLAADAKQKYHRHMSPIQILQLLLPLRLMCSVHR